MHYIQWNIALNPAEPMNGNKLSIIYISTSEATVKKNATDERHLLKYKNGALSTPTGKELTEV